MLIARFRWLLLLLLDDRWRESPTVVNLKYGTARVGVPDDHKARDRDAIVE